MSLFEKSKNGIMDVIRCDETNYLIWKWHPSGTSLGENQRENAIRWGSSLRVKEGSVAVFVYSNGRNTVQDYIKGPVDTILSTRNLPAISSLIGLVYNGNSPFQAEVYFINLANTIQLKFAVQYFDVYDSELQEFGVPVAVRGSIDFNIQDYKGFIKIHRLDNFSMSELQTQIRDTVSENVKKIVANAPDTYSIPVIQLEKKIFEIKSSILSLLTNKLYIDYGVTVKDVNLEAIDIDKDSAGYQELKSITKDLTAATLKSRNKAKNKAESRDITGNQTLNMFEKAATKFIDIKENQFIRHKKAQTEYAEAVEHERAGGLGAAGAKIIGSVGKMFSAKNQKHSADTLPPPIPIVCYNVAVNDQSTGPFDLATLADMANSGHLTPNSLVWKKGMEQWEKAGNIDELKTFFENVMPPIPPQI